MLYPDQGHGESEAYPENTGSKAGIHSGWDTSPPQGTKHNYSHLGAI